MRVRIRRNTLTIQAEEKKAEEATPKVVRSVASAPLTGFSPTGRIPRTEPSSSVAVEGEWQPMDWAGLMGNDLSNIEQRVIADAILRATREELLRMEARRTYETSTATEMMDRLRTARPMLPPSQVYMDRYYMDRGYRYYEDLERLSAEAVRGDSNAANTEAAEGIRGTGTGGETDQADS